MQGEMVYQAKAPEAGPKSKARLSEAPLRAKDLTLKDKAVVIKLNRACRPH
jgi:hypothetical protein